MSVEAKVLLVSKVEIEVEGESTRVISTVYLPRRSMLGPMGTERLKEAKELGPKRYHALVLRAARPSKVNPIAVKAYLEQEKARATQEGT